MNISLFYLVSIFALITILLFVIYSKNTFDANLVILLVALIVGNSGYYAIVNSQNIYEAILAQKLSYTIWVFAPLQTFLLLCSISKIHLSGFFKIFLFCVQILLYLSVCTIGKFDLFYKNVVFRKENSIAFLTSTYGPMYFVLLWSMISYFIAIIVVASISKWKKTAVSPRFFDCIMFCEIMLIPIYMIEKKLEAKIEYVPTVFLVLIIMIIYVLRKINMFSLDKNSEILNRMFDSFGYIIFDKNLHYVGCNKKVKTIFPEFAEGSLEGKNLKSGGVFNTFLRLPLTDYVQRKENKKLLEKSFNYKGKGYDYSINSIKDERKRTLGYVIEISIISTEEEKYNEKCNVSH